MTKAYALLIALFVTISILGCSTTKTTPKRVQTVQDVQVYTTNNKNATITTKSIEAAFDTLGLSIAGNNDMNKPFSKRFGKLHYKIYNLAMFVDNDLTYKLVKKYPSFGALTPLTMSIWSDGNSMNIATLSINGMARATQIPLNDPDLITYATKITAALKAALPNGHFKSLNYTTAPRNKSLATNFVTELDLDGVSPEDYIEDFEAEFEGELEPLGFLLPNYTNLNEEIFEDKGYDAYDYYHTYSICKFDVIYPVSKLHPEAGAWAPCSFYLYKKKGENKMYMGFLSVENWISSLDIKDKESTKPLREAQGMIEKIITEMTE
ncbi:hypothetical protein [Sulfurimonas sp.]